MSRTTLARLCLAASFLSTPAMAQEPPPAPKPLPEHKILVADEGTWDATIKTYMGGPGAEPMVTKGSETNEVMPGGLWVLSKFDGDFGGAKFQGRGQYGYDPVKKKYVGTWLDSMSPTLSVLEGEYDAKTKTLTYVGDGYDPDHKAKYTQKMVTTTKDDGSRVFTLLMKYEGQPAEVKFMGNHVHEAEITGFGVRHEDALDIECREGASSWRALLGFISTPTLVDWLRPIIGSARALAPDLAEQHDHYLHGTSKR